MTYSDILRPGAKTYALLYDLSLVLGGSLVIALLAQVAIPLPFTPVPITGQTLGVLLIGALLGRWRGVVAVFAYLMEGLAGLPVFAGATAGPAVLVGPTGGYLVGFVFAAYLVGWFAEKGWDRTVWKAFVMMAAGTGIILTTGAILLTAFIPAGQVFNMGVLPFLPGAMIKILIAMVLLPAGWKFLDRGK